MGEIKSKQRSQKYSEKEDNAIIEAAAKENLKVATFIRKCVLDKINFKK